MHYSHIQLIDTFVNKTENWMEPNFCVYICSFHKIIENRMCTKNEIEMLFGKMEAQKIICIHTVLFHGNVRCTNYANSVKNKLKHLSWEQIAAAIPAIRFAMILVLHIHFIRFSSLDRASHTVSGKERERERERIGGEKNKICKMKINGNEKSVRRVAKQTHTHARRGDYNNLQRNKRHSAPINTGGGAVPPPRRAAKSNWDYLWWHTLLLGYPMPYAIVLHADTFFLFFSCCIRCGRCHRCLRVC